MTKSFFPKFYIVLVLIISMAFCIVCADIFSSFITVGTFSFTNIDVKQNSFELYAINLSTCATKLQASEQAKNYRSKNAAGYVWEHDNNFYVLASAYINEADAKKVQEKLESSEVTSNIIVLDFAEIKISGEYTQQEKTALLTATASFKTAYKELYDISVSLDTSVKSNIEAKILLGNLKSTLTKIKSDFDSLLSSKITNSLLNIKLALAESINKIDKLIEYEKDDLSAEIKYNYFDILWSQKKLES